MPQHTLFNKSQLEVEDPLLSLRFKGSTFKVAALFGNEEFSVAAVSAIFIVVLIVERLALSFSTSCSLDFWSLSFSKAGRGRGRSDYFIFCSKREKKIRIGVDTFL